MIINQPPDVMVPNPSACRSFELSSGKLGIVVLEISPGSPAARALLLPGDILIGAAARAFQSLDDLQFAIDAAPEAVDAPRFLPRRTMELAARGSAPRA